MRDDDAQRSKSLKRKKKKAASEGVSEWRVRYPLLESRTKKIAYEKK